MLWVHETPILEVIFCDTHWDLICCNKWHLGTSEISTPQKIAAGSRFHVWHGTKTTEVFLPADEEASWFLLPSLVSLLSAGTVQQENAYSCLYSKWQVRSEKANQPNRKRWGARLVDVVKHLPHNVFLLWHHH